MQIIKFADPRAVRSQVLGGFCRWIDAIDEASALEDDPVRRTGPFRIDGNLAFDDLSPGSNLQALIARSTHQLQQAELYFVSKGSKVNFHDDKISFVSPVTTEIPQNNISLWQCWPSYRRRKFCLLVPHWNSAPSDYAALCRALQLAGIFVARLIPPYHNGRRSPDQRFAEQMVSASLGQTIRSIRQAVLEMQAVTDWAIGQGFKDISVVGSSLGSCIAVISAATNARVKRLVLVHVADDFAEAVWTGRATQHIRQELEPHLGLPELSAAWSIISPRNYPMSLSARATQTLVIRAHRDTVFPNGLGARFTERFRAAGVPLREIVYQCGHYSIARAPFSWLVLLQVLRFL